MTDQEDKSFAGWFLSSKYGQVVFPSVESYRIALDGWQACAEQYEAKLKVAEDALEYFVNSSGAEPSLSVAYTKASEALNKIRGE